MGFLGVVSRLFLGILISILESYGERIGHEFTSAVSLPIFVTILNSLISQQPSYTRIVVITSVVDVVAQL